MVYRRDGRDRLHRTSGELVLLLTIARDHLWFGIGAGQYGVYRGERLYSDPLLDPGYSPNMDFLKVQAEVGLVGFIIILALLSILLYRFVRTRHRIPAGRTPRFFAFLLGAVGILLNMFVGYEPLHGFFSVNIGFLLYLTELGRELGGGMEQAAYRREGGLPNPAGEPATTVAAS
jgi:O-antigen ligase